MSGEITLTIDGVEVRGQAGQTILHAAALSGLYIPHLCAKRGLTPWGSCRVCTVLVNGRPQAACIQPIAEGMVIENETEKLRTMRRELIEMLFVEGNHFCPVCEKSGNCELQAMGYRMAVTTPAHTFQNPKRLLDASHHDVFVDGNRCILCGRCVRASRDVDGKNVFQFVGRGTHSRVAVNSGANLAGTNLSAADAAARLCPVGSILVKRVGYAVPVGRRLYDQQPIGSDIEGRRAAAPKEGR
jgi:[NiFe] hydrogenase diaphorase moiety small subunit